MKVISYPLGQLQANCYFLIKKEECLLIDPGDDADFILGKIQQADLHLVGVMATHGHFDHVMAVGEIQESFDVPLYISKKDTFLLRRTKKSSEFFLGFSVPVLPIKKIKNLNIENWKLKIIETPGHTPGSVCYYFPEEKVIFTGDTLFKDGIGRYDFSYSSKNDLVNSLKKILKLPEETIVYPGHGAKTTILEEKDILTTIY
jgi:glyoxylase-like metal-dependent hydrolase (beta-lactamase superfamily II)